MSSTLSSATVASLSLYYGNDIPPQMSEVRTGILRDLQDTVTSLMNTISPQSPQEVQRLRDEEEKMFQASRTETDEYMCRYEECGDRKRETVWNKENFLDHQATHQHVHYRCLNCNGEFRYIFEYEGHHSDAHEGDMNLELVEL
ncbi:hypothetical protein DFP73DRAFT_585525 [Morchella snyderi]|nr:hypothetical protein DFP73DRAFT_585525 [Morchella snyderi]